MSLDYLLIELGTEELPPTALQTLSRSFSAELVQGLVDAQLISAQQRHAAQSFASPRRLALLMPEVAARQADQSVQKRGPAVAAAFDAQGNPSAAALGFAKSCGVAVDQLERLATTKGEWLSHTANEAGKPLEELLTSIIELAIKRLPIAKRMRWGDGEEEFVRPVHWLVAMHGSKVIPATALGLAASNITHGHRFHSTEPVTIANAADYANTLHERGHVIASFDERQQVIAQQLGQLADSFKAQIEPDQALLDEVTGLVELPVALLGEFDTGFLEVPAECLISAMRDHQKYFHLIDQQGNLAAKFITVSNIKSSNPTQVIAGNERVLRARLADAQFFWESDRKQPLESLLPKLDAVTFHAKLGSVGQKRTRLIALATVLAPQIGADVTVAARAASLAKADLVTNMVGEFDKLQGLMGRYYANLDGEDERVGASIEQHYWPKYSGDLLPQTREAQAVALADRVDSLVGIYSAGEVPTGDKDPHSLRRGALAILRILIEQGLPLGLTELIDASATAYQAQDIAISQEVKSAIANFILSRLPAYYQNLEVNTNAINSVMACAPNKPLDFDQRLQAVKKFGELEEAHDLAAANKRISNILKKQNTEISTQVDQSILSEAAEVELYKALETVSKPVTSAFDAGDYAGGLKQLASLRSPVDEFFENVMVMSENPAQQRNRLALLKRIQHLFLRVADISQLQA